MDRDGIGFSALHRVREAFNEVTPLLRDCGALCGRACCQPDEDGRGGMLLFPGEEGFYPDLLEGFLIRKDFSLGEEALLLTCPGACAREARPLACRVFPLAFGEREGRPEVFLDPRAWPLCPLMPSGTEGLSASFVQTAKKAADILFEVPALRAFIIRQQALIRRFSDPIWQDGGNK